MILPGILAAANGGAPPLAGNARVSGTDNTLWMGDYIFQGQLNGKNWYYSASNPVRMYWTGTRWVLYSEEDMSDGYRSTDNVAEPWLVTTWTVGPDGGLPLPIVIEI